MISKPTYRWLIITLCVYRKRGGDNQAPRHVHHQVYLEPDPCQLCKLCRGQLVMESTTVAAPVGFSMREIYYYWSIWITLRYLFWHNELYNTGAYKLSCWWVFLWVFLRGSDWRLNRAQAQVASPWQNG